MKKILFSTIFATLLFLAGCQDLELNPLSEGSTESWFSNEAEFTMALNEFYRHFPNPGTTEANRNNYWWWEANRWNHTCRFSDDWNQRENLYDWNNGGFTSELVTVSNTWSSNYQGITRANTVLENVKKARSEGRIPEESLLHYEGEASFFRACFYSYLIFLFGDVPFYTEYIKLDDAVKLGRSDHKTIILEQIYKDFDRAIETLPPTRTGLQRVTQGTAYAFKARTAIWMLDWPVAAAAAKGCIDLDVYSLHPDFRSLFLTKTRTSSEFIFALPRSKALMNNADATANRLPRMTGTGNNTAQPSWELLCAFTCIDGLPIDKSPLYDPKNPFKYRDPRLAETMVEIGSEFLGYVYDPGVPQVRRVATGAMVANQDSRLVNQFAAFNGMCIKKGVDEDWTTGGFDTDCNVIIMRYADVLLMYAEAKIEMNQIDATVLEAINRVRSRGYGVAHTQTGSYPAVIETDQSRLRTIIRTERRAELAWENRRWFALIRWRLAEAALARPIYCHPQGDVLQAIIDAGDYFFPSGVLPVIDENGLVDLSPLLATGQVITIVQRVFDPRQYVMPIPANEIRTNPNIKQNDGY